MIQEREKEFEDGIFFGGLGKDQKKKNEAKRIKHKKGEVAQGYDSDYNFDLGNLDGDNKDHDNLLHNFAGININANEKLRSALFDNEKPDALNLSMKQYLIA